MDAQTKKNDLTDEQIKDIRNLMAKKADMWFISGGGSEFEGMKVFRTQEDSLYVLKDIETGVELGMCKDVSCGGAVTKLSFVILKENVAPEEKMVE